MNAKPTLPVSANVGIRAVVVAPKTVPLGGKPSSGLSQTDQAAVAEFKIFALVQLPGRLTASAYMLNSLPTARGATTWSPRAF